MSDSTKMVTLSAETLQNIDTRSGTAGRPPSTMSTKLALF